LINLPTEYQPLEDRDALTDEEAIVLANLLARALVNSQIDLIVNDHLMSVEWGIGLLDEPRKSESGPVPVVVADLICCDAKKVQCGLARAGVLLRTAATTDSSERN
jgi:hypothetical protein